MSYLRLKRNSRLSLDPSYPSIDLAKFNNGADWVTMYAGAKEAISDNAPKSLGKGVEIRMMVDSDHAGEKVTRRSSSGYMIFLNISLIDWLSKKRSQKLRAWC